MKVEPHIELCEALLPGFRSRFGGRPQATAYAPGRIEVLGNHTDYNEGFVLSAAIDRGTCFCAGKARGGTARLVAMDVDEEVAFPVNAPIPEPPAWSKYVTGVVAGLARRRRLSGGFNGIFLGNIPVGAGLSSSAALEMSAGLALGALYGLDIPRIELARLGQEAEHEFAGVKCGLLDQITSLFGQAAHLVLTDFRSLEIQAVPLGDRVAFLLCDTGVRHALAESDYNKRREECRAAADFFASRLSRPVSALRDVTMADWRRLADRMDPVVARRAAHVIGENERVLAGRDLLNHGDLQGLGRLMCESHASSKDNFENSCPELDFLVREAARLKGVLGARLTGGGFGGSALIMLEPGRAEKVAASLSSRFWRRFKTDCATRLVAAADAAHVVTGP